MPRTRRSTEELRQHVAAATAQLQQQRARRTTGRQATISSRSAGGGASTQALLHPRVAAAAAAATAAAAAAAAAAAVPSVNTATQDQYRRALQQATNSLGVEVMSYGARGNQGGSNPHGLHTNKVPQMPLSTMAYAQQTGVSRQAASGYSAAVASAAGLAMPYSAAAAALSAQQLTASYPINPDVKLKKLPFYDILAELLKPSSLAPQGSGRYQESGFSFSLTPQQANKIANSRDLRPGKQDYNVQVQMRFCLLETSCEQEDNFPPNIAVKINDKMCPLPSPIPTNKPGVEPKRPSRPVNITALCRISPTVTNRVQVSWASEYGRCYVISVYLVQKLSSDDLLHRLKSKGVRIADFTRSLIKQKLNEDADCEIATTSLRCSLMCPLGKMRMLLPCRANTCNHLQCFDASLYLQMNERKPTWTCPVCDKPAIYDTLVIDGYFQDVLRLNTTSNEVTLHKDGSWSPLVAKKERPEPQAEKRKSVVAIETLSDSDDDTASATSTVAKVLIDDSVVEDVTPSAGGAVKKKASDVEIITLESSSEEEDDDDEEDDDEESNPPPAKRPYNPAEASAGDGSAIVATVDVNGSSSAAPPAAAILTTAAAANGGDAFPLAESESDVTAVASMQQSSVIAQDCGAADGSTATGGEQSSGGTAVMSASVASSLAQLPAATTVLATSADTPSASATVAPASDSPNGSEGAKSDDSWSVGTVDPGKRLIFRKSMSCSSNGTSATTATANGGEEGSLPPTTTTVSSACLVPQSPPTPSDPLSVSSPPGLLDTGRSRQEEGGGTSVASLPASSTGSDGCVSSATPRPTRTSSRATRFQGITWEGDSDTTTTDDDDFEDDSGREEGESSNTTSNNINGSNSAGFSSSRRHGRKRKRSASAISGSSSSCADAQVTTSACGVVTVPGGGGERSRATSTSSTTSSTTSGSGGLTCNSIVDAATSSTLGVPVSVVAAAAAAASSNINCINSTAMAVSTMPVSGSESSNTELHQQQQY